jgi:hypothetical protein
MPEPLHPRHTRLRLAKQLFNWIPHDGQRRFWLSCAQSKIAACGRRWGKSECAAYDLATFALFYPHSKQLVVSPTYDQSRIIGAKLADLAAHPLLKSCAKSTQSPAPQVSFGDSVILIRTAGDDGRNLRGHSAHRIFVDEAAFLDGQIIDDVLAPMLADTAGDLILLSTPFGKNHFYRRFAAASHPLPTPLFPSDEAKRSPGEGVPSIQNPPPPSASFQFPSWTNPYVDIDYINTQRLQMPDFRFNTEYGAQFVDLLTRPFSSDDIHACLMPDFPPLMSKGGWRVGSVVGCDLGKLQDYTVLIALAPTSRLPADPLSPPHPSSYTVIGFQRFARLSWPQQKAKIASFCNQWNAEVLALDATGLGDPIADDLRAVGLPVQPMKLAADSKSLLVESLAVALTKHEVRFPPIPELIHELEVFEAVPLPSGQIRYTAPQGMHDDCVCALALALRAARNLDASPCFYIATAHR